MKFWPRRRSSRPAAPVRETLPWHDGVRGYFTRGAASETTPEQGAALFDRHARHLVGISGEEFLRRWDAGELTWDCAPGVTSVAMLIPFVRP